MTDEQLIRLLIKETIKTELNEFWGNSKEDAAVTAAKKMLDAHFSGIGKKYDDSVVNNLISKLPSQDQAIYKGKLTNIKKQPIQQTQQPETATQIQMRKNAGLRRFMFANENKKRRKAALR